MRRPSPALLRLAALLAPLVSCAVLAAVRDEVTPATAVLVLVVWVVAAAAAGDRLAAVLAALSSGAWFDFFLTEPYLRFTISDPDDVEAAVLLVVIGLAVAELALWGRREQRIALRRSGYLEDLAGAGHEVVGDQIAQLVGADSCRFVEGEVRDPRVAVVDESGVVRRNGREVDVDRSGLPSDEYLAIPVRLADGTTGHYLLGAASRRSYPTREELRVAMLLAHVGLTRRRPGPPLEDRAWQRGGPRA